MELDLKLKDGDTRVTVTIIKNGKHHKTSMNLETVSNFLVKTTLCAERAILMRNCVLDGGEYETNLHNTIFRVTKYDQERDQDTGLQTPQDA